MGSDVLRGILNVLGGTCGEVSFPRGNGALTLISAGSVTLSGASGTSSSSSIRQQLV